MEYHPLKDRQRIRRASNRTRHIQRYARQQERIPAQLLALFRKSLEIPHLADIEPEQTEEVLMEH
jgi:hypothetical protein